MVIYTVKPGDTVNALAAEYGLAPEQIISDNGLARTDFWWSDKALFFYFRRKFIRLPAVKR